MEKLVYCDTHVIVGLHVKNLDFFPRPATRLLEHGHLLISPIVLLELEYLYEVGKIKTSAEKISKELEKNLGLKICDQNFLDVIHESLNQSWTWDPFDRLIVAQAALTKSSLITKDEFILKHYTYAVWE